MPKNKSPNFSHWHIQNFTNSSTDISYYFLLYVLRIEILKCEMQVDEISPNKEKETQEVTAWSTNAITIMENLFFCLALISEVNNKGPYSVLKKCLHLLNYSQDVKHIVFIAISTIIWGLSNTDFWFDGIVYLCSLYCEFFWNLSYNSVQQTHIGQS